MQKICFRFDFVPEDRRETTLNLMVDRRKTIYLLESPFDLAYVPLFVYGVGEP